MQDGFNDPLWRQVVSGAQMLFVAFGALVLMPLITGLDPNVALFTAGIGTLLFQLVTGRQVPVFLASSFAFITPIILAKGQFGLAATMGGVMAAGFVYTFLGLMVKIKGTGFIDRMLPPVVIGPVIISIGLAMAPIAANMAMGKGGDGAELMPQDRDDDLDASAADHPDRRRCSAKAFSAWCRSFPACWWALPCRSPLAWSIREDRRGTWLALPTSPRRSSTGRRSCSSFRWPWRRPSSTSAG
jgi:uracil permease